MFSACKGLTPLIVAHYWLNSTWGGSGGVEGWVVVGNAISLDVHHLFHDEPINEHLETSTFPLCKQITKTHLDIE